MNIHFPQNNLFRGALSSVTVIGDTPIKSDAKYAVLYQTRMILKVVFAYLPDKSLRRLNELHCKKYVL